MSKNKTSENRPTRIPIQQWLLSFGADAMPLEPDWLVENWRNEIKKMAELAKI